MKKLIAIDPGTTESAVLIWDGQQVTLPEIISNDALRFRLLNGSQHPIACEMIASYGMAVGREVFETCLMIGRIQEIAAQRNQPCSLIYRLQVKNHLCHTSKAKDANIRQALIDRFGCVGTKKNPGPLFGISSHLWAALGVAVTAFDLSN